MWWFTVSNVGSYFHEFFSGANAVANAGDLVSNPASFFWVGPYFQRNYMKIRFQRVSRSGRGSSLQAEAALQQAIRSGGISELENAIASAKLQKVNTEAGLTFGCFVEWLHGLCDWMFSFFWIRSYDRYFLKLVKLCWCQSQICPFHHFGVSHFLFFISHRFVIPRCLEKRPGPSWRHVGRCRTQICPLHYFGVCPI